MSKVITKEEIKKTMKFLKENKEYTYFFIEKVFEKDFLDDTPIEHKITYLIKYDNLLEELEEEKEKKKIDKEALRKAFIDLGIKDFKNSYEKRLENIIKVEVK
jgi:hypothetical protein